MADSAADSEADASDGRSRFIKNFRPVGDRLGSRLAGSFNVRQEIIESLQQQRDAVSMIRMTFSPVRPEDEAPSVVFLVWAIGFS